MYKTIEKSRETKLAYMDKNLGRRRHLFHLVNPSPWPLLTSISSLFFVSGLAFYMHNVSYGG